MLKVLTLFFLGAMLVLIVTHAKGFATSAGTVFTGFNNLGTTLTGQRIGAGELCVIVPGVMKCLAVSKIVTSVKQIKNESRCSSTGR